MTKGNFPFQILQFYGNEDFTCGLRHHGCGQDLPSRRLYTVRQNGIRVMAPR
jgi:hypothetical protein